MKLAILLAALITVAACALPPIKDTPELRATVEAKVTPTVLGKPPMLGESIRFTVHITPTPLPDWEYTTTPTLKASE